MACLNINFSYKGDKILRFQVRRYPFLFELSHLNTNFALNLGYLNRAYKNPAPQFSDP